MLKSRTGRPPFNSKARSPDPVVSPSLMKLRFPLRKSPSPHAENLYPDLIAALPSRKDHSFQLRQNHHQRSAAINPGGSGLDRGSSSGSMR